MNHAGYMRMRHSMSQSRLAKRCALPYQFTCDSGEWQMSDTKWQPGKKDAVFLAVVIAVIVLLLLGSGERTTQPTPNDDVHRSVTSHEACMKCHDADGVRPQPAGHTGSAQCFQCHTQPRDWQGANK